MYSLSISTGGFRHFVPNWLSSPIDRYIMKWNVSAYRLLMASRFIIKLLLIKWNIQKTYYLMLLLNQYHFQNYFVATLNSPPDWPPLKKFLLWLWKFPSCLWKFQNFFPTLNLGWKRHYDICIYIHIFRVRYIANLNKKVSSSHLQFLVLFNQTKLNHLHRFWRPMSLCGYLFYMLY